jgi:hypothetical protein
MGFIPGQSVQNHDNTQCPECGEARFTVRTGVDMREYECCACSFRWMETIPFIKRREWL